MAIPHPKRGSGWTGPKDTGSTEYTPVEFMRVTKFFLANQPVSLEELSKATRVEGRPLRKILAEADGELYVLAERDGMFSTTTDWTEAQAKTRSLERSARTMLARAERRKRMAEGFDNRQGNLL